VAIKCPKCHSANLDTSSFCSDCGTRLGRAGDIRVSRTKTLEDPTKELTTGTTFANRYQIIEKLGQGGMGEVYRAIDKELNEEVALKLMNPQIASDQKTVHRFSSELKLARKIIHKNVGRMYELMEEKGTRFITMEYVSGEDLRSLMRRVRRLDVETAVSIAKQVCEGLGEAHRLGVVHRDLKPGNIMIDKEGRARIMDFGIARSLKAAGMTEAGAMIGTPGYMSPEQAEGKDVDQRSDIYSLGVILYEMVSGRIPFEGDTAMSTAMKHKTESPRDPREYNTQIPEDLSRVILKCLEKDRKKRYQTAEELHSVLGHIGEEHGAQIIAKPKWKHSIAVLPFADLSPNRDQEYFCDGIAEELINAATKIKDLRVVARTSAFAFKGKDMDIREIGQKLNVETILEGSVRKAGNRLRITSQLINVADGYHLWSDKFDREMEDIFAIQDEISMAIVDNLKIKLLTAERESIKKRFTADLDAYNLYLKGRYFGTKPSIEALNKALEYFKKGIEKDPNFALAYAGLAYIYATLGVLSFSSPQDMWPKAKKAIEKALELDPELAEAHEQAAYLSFWYEWDWQATAYSYDQTFALNPGNAAAHAWYAWYCLSQGRFEEAVREIKQAQDLDPLMPLFYAMSVGIHGAVGKLDEAVDEFHKSMELDPNSGLAYFHLGTVYWWKGMMKEALAAFQKSLKLEIYSGWAEGFLGFIYVKQGERERAGHLLQELIGRKKKSYVSSYCLALLCGALGKRDEAFEYLDKAYEERDTLMPFLNIYTKDASEIVSDPRFEAVQKKMGLAT
jgi:serine/threonine protein kinase